MSETLEGLKAENTRLKQELADVLLQKSEEVMQEEKSLERISFLEAMLETIPIGIVLAEAPSGKITTGNSLAEEMVRHPIYNSEDVHSYGEWVSFHENGKQVESHEYPLAKVVGEGHDYAELDVNYQRGDGTMFWMRIVCRPVFASDGQMRGATVALIDIDNERHLMAQQDVLIAELNHRVKNAFTVVKSIVSQSLRGTNASEGARDTIDSRLDAYAKAHSQLIGNRWDRAHIGKIAEDTIARIAGGRITMKGPDVEVPSRIAMSLSMAFYELATNALKHGSLSDTEGRVELMWDYVTPQQDTIRLVWVELDGPAPVSPTTKGFGSKITNQILAAETYGKVIIDYPKAGFKWSLEMPLNKED
ncbi:HWE histidine kinase domain-containing protein [uncultured Sulfitobacter sp.]|uniref:HWE histidine kinase domain-containing protein n=1 Tax=uncultured Sulfitobacter sp. TaxID=191468 RepID=UPI00260C741F|nr:HWE histidine kinase domain-containing protein [uncultured Sulfitobacter sp.]